MGMDTTLVCKCHRSDDRLVGGKRNSCKSGDQGRQRINLPCFNASVYLVQMFKCHHHFFKRRIACPLSKTVYSHMTTACPGFQGSKGVGKCKTKVIMTMYA